MAIANLEAFIRESARYVERDSPRLDLFVGFCRAHRDRGGDEQCNEGKPWNHFVSPLL
jgi:hypothetical protein